MYIKAKYAPQENPVIINLSIPKYSLTFLISLTKFLVLLFFIILDGVDLPQPLWSIIIK